ncbi:C-X-C chemokine receptor type 2-like [Paramacrobiotus metropolitanus]|uniref:C-X-C chemokine receptor type 2-like n=1 Tax=Paramacrobiotus metropolitanus TaxID=2943436 RepID=UPI002445E0FE|nr:C-X-C chemokine receptor type 2-like [Paramacrobiotus metropolitanus]
MNTSNSTLPNTTTDLNTASWKSSAVISITLTTTGVITNGFTVLLFLTNRSLWSPFSVYLFNLVLANLFFYATQGGIDIINNLYATWWLPSAFCTVYLYGLFVVTLIPIFIHPLISLNRIWALWTPISYRNHHTYRVSVGLCAAAWWVTHAVGLPGLVENALYYRKPESEVGCTIDTTTSAGQMAYILVIQFITLIALALMIVAPKGLLDAQAIAVMHRPFFS